MKAQQPKNAITKRMVATANVFFAVGKFRGVPGDKTTARKSTPRLAGTSRRGHHDHAFVSRAVLYVAVLLCLSSLASADQKLILKDGSDQIVSEYQIKGDRVRFYSMERKEWEEIPESLVDWKATEEAKRAAEKPPEIDEDLKKPAAPPRFSVAPGVLLPESDGVYVYDGKTLLGLAPSHAEIRNDQTRQILGKLARVPIIKGRAYAEVPGASAKVTVTGPNPVIYLHLSKLFSEGYGIVRMKPGKNSTRVAEEISISPISGTETESQDRVPATVEQVQPESGGTAGVVRLTPKEPLRPGEYAVVEYVEKGKMNLYLWDFSYRPDTRKR
ncbi:MAG: hypothetical protein HYX72_03660 [Acidobacteria bacterium]|nr:hypothetical protein [Acidobacteriota bacterium]